MEKTEIVMDYEKKYNEALERAQKTTRAGGDVAMEIVQYIFPELAVSEDERIRAVILKLVLGMRDEIFTTADKLVTKPKVLAWLEKQKVNAAILDELVECYKNLCERGNKGVASLINAINGINEQKEQKHPNGCFTCDEYKKGYEAGRLNGFTAGYNKAMKEVDQKKQKPVEIHIDNPNIQKLDPDVKVTTSDSSADGKELLYVSNKSYNIGFRDGVASVKPADRFEEARKKYQVEWSEEDENIRQSLILLVSNDKINGYTEFYKAQEITCDKAIAFLKSLRPQYHGDVTMTEAYKMGLEAGKASSWRPSEEQMEHLQRAINCYESDWGENKLLRSLIYDLKNMM